MMDIFIFKFREFRNKIFGLFKYRADSTMDLIDAVAGQVNKESVVKLSLSHLFRRTFSSITDAVDNLFRRKANTHPTPHEYKEEQTKMTQLLAEQCPHSTLRPFELFAVDCTSNSRIYSDKLSDRGYVHSPTKIPGQKPITVGHQYSTVVYLPERTESAEPHWVIPLATMRVKSQEIAACIGMKQLVEIANFDKFKDELCVAVNDTAYSHSRPLSIAAEQSNLINISRIRNNRKFYLPHATTCEKRKRGRPQIYGDQWALKDPGEANEIVVIDHYSAKGKLYHIKIERWYDRLEKGHAEITDANGGLIQSAGAAFLFDAVKVTILKEDGTDLYKKPLWLMITGKRRREPSLPDIARSYFRRFDIEHFFRFAKQRLLLDDFQTPNTRHEENWWHLCLISYAMLYEARNLARYIRNPWEKKQKESETRILTPSQVQRDYERIIASIGTPACHPKPRGKSAGRAKGAQIAKRKDQKVIRKSKAEHKEAIKPAA